MVTGTQFRLEQLFDPTSQLSRSIRTQHIKTTLSTIHQENSSQEIFIETDELRKYEEYPMKLFGEEHYRAFYPGVITSTGLTEFVFRLTEEKIEMSVHYSSVRSVFYLKRDENDIITGSSYECFE